MKKYLELEYYNNIDFKIPEYLKPTIEKNQVGIQTHYIDLSESKYGEEIFKQFHNKSDLELIEDLVNKHGVFFEKFLSAIFRTRIHPFFYDEENSNRLLNSCKKYYKKTESRNKLIDRIKNDFLKISIIRLKNDIIYKKIVESVLEKSKPRKCAICDKSYKPINLPDWVYYGSNGNDTICFECPTKKTQNKTEIKVLIRQLVSLLNFIPNADFNLINYNFSSRVKKENWIDVSKMILQIGLSGNEFLGADSIFKKKFGSWFKALVESNVLPNGHLKSTRGIRCIAKSGNECNSLDELFVDNWLFENNIISIKEPMYPSHPIYNVLGRRRADWKVNDYFIEYFGLKGEEAYDKKTQEKLLLVDSLNLKLISIFPSDLSNLSEKLSILKIDTIKN